MTTPAVAVNAFIVEFGTESYGYDCNGNVFDYAIDYTLPTRQHYDYRPASVTNPKSASGWRDPAPWYRQTREATLRVPGDCWVRTTGPCVAPKYIELHVGSISMADALVDAPEVPTWVSDIASTKAYAALKQQQANFSVMFAERKETAELFSHSVETIAREVKGFRHKYPKLWEQVKATEGTPRWKGIPQRWLELQYGWKPLMADVSGACSALSKRERSNDAYKAHVVGHGKGKDIIQQRIAYGFGVTGMLWQDVTYEYTYDCTVRLWYDLANPALATFASLGLTNPLELVWERIPYSFVVDWFLPVGNWLSTLDADFGWTPKAACTSKFSRVKAFGIPGHTTVWPYFEVGNNSSAFKLTAMLFRRGVGAPGVGLPHFKNPFSSVHVANALSLLLNAFR